MTLAQTLKSTVEQELTWDPTINAENIGVSVNNGVVELDGHVSSFPQKWAAEQAALRSKNVTAIASEIIVDLPFDGVRSDEQIADSASNSLSWNLLVPKSIKVMVANGQVTLAGSAEWFFQKAEAERVVRSLRGVKLVVNEIQLKPKVSVAGVKTKIEDALKRAALRDAGAITVEALGTVITLRGKVDTWNERQIAEHAAYEAPGVSDVSNLIQINL